MGYAPVARHRAKAITLWRQGDITYVLNAELITKDNAKNHYFPNSPF